ncbi:ABC transporter permease [Coxiella burnetii]|uniref:ABC transporter permease n=1 Tax=Coxiella burnetii TaxID=777 RepID=UPI0000ECFFE3|nr:ABC transporter permease [Coxiella burnetii]ACJ21096.1 export ABC transporter permease protein [Coxiella burnetii CbuK_Q154]AIT64167.1 ABC-2 type transporter [Coxiella burnetii str. Namibia]EAX32134.1 mannose-1-phosphate guanyltransferase [Coxiella burnetii 'MSU Goat Q177']PHH57604.1 ABC transporter permease [Coxiella burnetii]UYK69791.1 ABC transporter permease [Coxiella burnetii]
MKHNYFSWHRCVAVAFKEFVQMRRDRLTFAMIIGIPLIQLILFGFAINTNPKYLPTALVSADHSDFTRTFIRGVENTEYFRITAQPKTLKEADTLLAKSKVLFVINIPPDFTRNLIRGMHPQILIEADASDPVAAVNALAAIPTLETTIFNPLFKGNLNDLRSQPEPLNIVLHRKYNPENITQYNIVPGLLGVVLTMTMVLITSLAMTRERERGTGESLLATPVRPLEVMIGKITPYIIVGYLQVSIILVASRYLFDVPIEGSITLLLISALPFIAANLSVGLTFSSIAKNQLQAVQSAFFFFLPSILLSGFMFPFAGMPQWARWLGEILPLTHFLRITRGILLKGNSWYEILPDLWPILLFAAIALLIGLKRYRQTLD